MTTTLSVASIMKIHLKTVKLKEMKRMIRKVFELISSLLEVKNEYNCWIKSSSQQSLAPLVEEAKNQKTLQVLELCRLFEVRQEECVDMEAPSKNSALVINDPERLIEQNELFILDQYMALVDEEKNVINAFETYVLNSHIKTQKYLLSTVNPKYQI